MQTLLLFLFPLLGMCVVRLVSGNKAIARAAFMLSLVPLVDVLWKISMFDPNGGGQFLFDQFWVENLGISLKFGLDGIGLLMVLLTNALVPLIIYSSFDREIKDPKNYFSLIFLMQFA